MINDQTQRRWKLGVVSYLNAKPLIAGLESNPQVSLRFDVPARLPQLLDEGFVDAALVPVIDLLQEDRAWQIVSDACIGCDGETYTVRVFSRVAPEAIRRMHVDGDSHTSVALARVIWQEQFGRPLEIVPFADHQPTEDCEAILLIGDKVVNHSLTDYEIETDLGSAWKSLTSLPFVFAVWAAPQSLNTHSLARVLSEARDAGVASTDLIAEDFGPGMGWPVTLAKRYLSTRLKFTLGPRQRRGIEKFLILAEKYDLVSMNDRLVFA